MQLAVGAAVLLVASGFAASSGPLQVPPPIPSLPVGASSCMQVGVGRCAFSCDTSKPFVAVEILAGASWTVTCDGEIVSDGYGYGLAIDFWTGLYPYPIPRGMGECSVDSGGDAVLICINLT